MTDQQTFEVIPLEDLLDRVRGLHQQRSRLVQIGATRHPDHLELNYSFDHAGALINLRLKLPAEGACVPSISSIYWCAIIYENEMHDLFNLAVTGMAVDFQGNLYQTTVKYPFGSPRSPAPPATLAPVSAAPAPSAANPPAR